MSTQKQESRQDDIKVDPSLSRTADAARDFNRCIPINTRTARRTPNCRY